jgi:PAS domain S-box-containing protein
MYSEAEKDLLLKAIDSFQRKIIVISPDFRILAANRYAAGITGAEIRDSLCHESLHGHPDVCTNCPAELVLQSGEPALADPGRRGSMTHQEMSCLYSYPIRSGETIEAMVVLDFKFPVLEGLQEQLQQSNAFLRNLLFSSVDGVIAADMNGKILIFNEAAAEVFGYRVDEAISGLNIRAIYPGDGARRVMRKLRSEEYGGKGKLRSLQVDIRKKSGEVIPISLNAAIVYEGEREVATIGFFHDLRETLRMKEELSRTQTQLLQSEKMASLGKLAAGVAHQLNNPLGGITLYSQLLMEEYDLDERAKEDLRRILKDAQRCRDTVKELLEFARQTRQDMRPHDINQAISRTLFLLENQALFQNIRIIRNFTPNLPMVHGDIQQLNHLFMNIILNAAEAMEGKGQLTIGTYCFPDNDRCYVEIEDSGPGIPEEVLPHIFEPFFTTKEVGKGTGLGLSLAYGIVQSHRGKIMAKSKPGEGTVFIIELPLHRQRNKGSQLESR